MNSLFAAVLLVYILASSGETVEPSKIMSADDKCWCPAPSPEVDDDLEIPQTKPTTNPVPEDALPVPATPTSSPSPSCNAAKNSTASIPASSFKYRVVQVFGNRCQLDCAGGTCRYCRRASAVRRTVWGGCYSHARSVDIDGFYRKHGGRVGFGEADDGGASSADGD